jgi:hypothetical protein
LTVAESGETTGDMGSNTYDVFCYPNHLGCWTTNSKEGTPTYKNYPGQDTGVRGYYYSLSAAASACAGEYMRPSTSQWQQLCAYLAQTSVDAGEKAFFMSGTPHAGSYFMVVTIPPAEWGGWDTYDWYWTPSGAPLVKATDQAMNVSLINGTGSALPVRCVRPN